MILVIPPSGRNDQNSILFIPELECHPKERILLLFLVFSFWNSPKRMHPKTCLPLSIK